jgi:glutathione S-transferase
MKLILHYTPSSPFCRFVLMTAIHKGINVQLYISNIAIPENQRIESVNPLRRVPVLEIYHDSGEKDVLRHSILICEYLDTLSEHNKIIENNFSFKSIYYSFLGITERALSLFYETRRAPELQSIDNMNKFKSTINMSLDEVEKLLETYPIANVNLITIILSALLGYLDFRLSNEIDWRENRPKLVKWFSEFQQQEVFQKTLSFEMADLEQGALYSYQYNLEVATPLNPFDTFSKRAVVIETAATASPLVSLPLVYRPL